MSDRYFVDKPIAADHVTLCGQEAHHLIHVMRATAGTRVTLFDGGGDEFSAAVERVGRTDVELSILARTSVDRELPFDLTLGVALPKGERQKWLVEKAVELGVTRIVPLRTGRGVAQPVEQALVAFAAGGDRGVEAMRPQPAPANRRAASVARFRGRRRCGKLFDGASGRRGHSSSSCTACHGDVRLAIGPEGGFADDEMALAVVAGWHTVDLGPRILRVETAALFLAAVVASRVSPLPLGEGPGVRA